MANTLFEDLPKERSFRVVAHRSRSDAAPLADD